MEVTSGDHVRSLTSDFSSSFPQTRRLDELRALPSRHLEALLNSTRSDLPDEILPPTLRVIGASGDALSFRGASAASPRITRFVIEQEFEGMVLSIAPAGGAFVARLVDLTREAPEEEAEIAFDEISPDDRSLIVPGALFSWIIGRASETNGQVRRLSELRFRRFFRFTPEAIARAEKDAADMLELLNDGNAEGS